MGLFSVFKQSNALYFPGCYTYFKFRENFELYKKIFSKLEIDFKMIEKKVCCGIPAFEAGYESEARKLARRNFEIFKEEKITSIITNSPCCYRMFLLEYPKFLPDWNIEPKNLWRIILAKLENKLGLIKNKGEGIIAYHDSCYLGRYCGIYDEPRKILELIGYNVKEIPDNKSESICCGSCGGLIRTNPKLANQIAKERLMQAKRAGISRIIVTSLDSYELLKKNSAEIGVNVFEFSEILALALGIVKKQEKTEIKEVSENKEENEEEILLETKENIKLEKEFKEEDYKYNSLKEE